MEYDIISASSVNKLKEKVKAAIGESWVPEGAATIMKSPQGAWLSCYQTMFREDSVQVHVQFLPPEEHYEHDQGYDVTCEICAFKDIECDNFWDVCEEGDKGYFKLPEQKPE